MQANMKQSCRCLHAAHAHRQPFVYVGISCRQRPHNSTPDHRSACSCPPTKSHRHHRSLC